MHSASKPRDCHTSGIYAKRRISASEISYARPNDRTRRPGRFDLGEVYARLVETRGGGGCVANRPDKRICIGGRAGCLGLPLALALADDGYSIDEERQIVWERKACGQ
jgi:hypothetical protein